MITVGSFRLHLLQTESFALDGGAMFSVVPKTLWSKEVQSDDRNRIDLVTRSLLIQTASRNILVDAGIGGKCKEKSCDLYKIRGPNIVDALKTVRLAPDQITDIVLTHLHFDHCGGLTRRENGRIAMIFPKAKIYVQKPAVESARNPSLKEKPSFTPEDIEPLLESGQIEELDGRVSLLDGLELIPQQGHSASMQIVKITANDKTFFYPCDAIPTITHLRVNWITSYDLLPIVMMEEKAALLKEAAEQKGIIFYAHDPKTQASTIKHDGKHYFADQVLEI